MGIDSDLRGEERIKQNLARKKQKYEKLSEQEKKYFDLESLANPFLDTRILHIAKDKEIKKILVGIDIEPAELLMAKELKDIDLVFSHHPLGIGLSHISDVMELQAEVLNQYGVPINIAEKLMQSRISEVARGVNGANHQRTIDAAKLLELNLVCFHTVCDNLAANYLKKEIERRKFERLEELISFLIKIPEYQEAEKIGAGPKIFVGSPDNYCGKIALTELTGGTEGSPRLYEKIAQSGIGTVVGMHVSEEHKKEAEQANLNMVIAGHISSDSLGVNLFLDELEKKGIQIIPCSGLIRVSRT